MPVNFPDIAQHNNPDLAFVDSTFVRGGTRAVANLTALYALSSKVDQLAERITRVWVASEAKYYVLTDIASVGSAGGWTVESNASTLQQVTDNGSTTTNSITAANLYSNGLVVATGAIFSNVGFHSNLNGNVRYSFDTNDLVLRAGTSTSNEYMRVFGADGNVAIGTSNNNGYKLDVFGSARVNGNLTFTNAGGVVTTNQFYASATNHANSIFVGWDATAVYLGYQMGSMLVDIGTGGTGKVRLRNTGGFQIESFTGSGTRMLVADSNGDISVQSIPSVTVTGTANYLSKFTGTSAIGNSQVFDNGTNVLIGTTVLSNVYTGANLVVASSTTFATQEIRGTDQSSLVLTTGVNVGSTPAVEIFNSYNFGIRYSATGDTTFPIFYDGTDKYTSFGANSSERMRISSAGRVLINTTTDNGVDRLQVSGSANFSSSVTASSFSGAGTGLTGTASSLSIGGNAATVTNGVYTTGSYADPSWITSLAWSKITGTPAIITGTGANGQIAYWSGTSTQTGNNNLAWDNTNSALNLGGFNFGSSAGISSTINVLSSATTSGVSLKSTNSASSNLSQFGVYLENNAGARSQLYKMNSNGTTYKTIAANDLGFYNGTGSGNIAILNDNASGNISLTAGGSSSPHMIISSGGNVGIGTVSPSYRLVVNRVTDGITAGIAGSTFGIRFDNGGTFSSGMSTIHGTDGTLVGSYQPIMLTGLDVRLGNSANERMRIASNGNIGIGTTNPSTILSVAGVRAVVSIVDTTTSSNTSFFGAYDDYLQLSINRNPSTGVFSNVNKATSQISLGGLNGDSQILFYTTTSNNTVPLERMRITGAGNVGIGTTSPAYPLQVRRAGGGGSLGISIDSVGSTDRVVQYFSVQDSESGAGSGHAFYYRAPSSTIDVIGIFLSESGNVGIGTTSPSTTLTVKSTNDNGYALTRPSNESVLHWRLSTTETGGDAYTVRYNTFNNNMIFSTYLGGGTGGDIIFRTGASGAGTETERMRITSAGNVGIGTTSPLFRLDARDSAIVSNTDPTTSGASSTGAFYIRGASAYAIGPNPVTVYPSVWRQQLENIQFFSGTSNLVWAMSANGGSYTNYMTLSDVGLGIGTTPSYPLHVQGTAYVNGGSSSLPLYLITNGTNIGSQIYFNNSYATAYCGISADTRGDVTLQVDSGGSGSDRGIKLNTGGNNTRIFITNNGNIGFRTTNQFGSGVGVVGIANATTVPTTNPTGGGVLYVEGGALKYRGSSGTITTIANA